MMKKKSLMVLVAVFLTFISGGCSQLGDDSSEAANPGQQPITLTIAYGASAGTTWHVVCEGVAEIIRETYPGSNINVIPGNSDSNLVRLQKKEIDLSISSTDSANSAEKGIETFTEPIPKDDLYSLFAAYDAKVQFFAMKKLGIKSINEIKERQLPIRISVHTIGSSVELTARRILAEYGITYEDIEGWGGRIVYVPAPDAAQMMGDGQLDAFFGLSAVPISNFIELEINREFILLPIEEEIIEIVNREYNYSPSLIPAGTYKGQVSDIPTISVINGLYASGSLPEETGYQITKALLDNIDKMQMVHAQMSDLTPEFMMKDMVYPMHPGALRAYEER